MMRSTVIALLVVFLSGLSAAQEGAFWRGNEQFQKGDYAAAATAYEEAIRQGGNGFALHFNLGNALLRAGRIGPALYHYRLAEKFEPRDEDLAANIALARSRRSVEIAPAEPPRFVSILLWPYSKLGIRPLFLIFAVLQVLGLACLHARVLLGRAWMSRLGIALAVFGLVAGAFLVTRALGTFDTPLGVILVEDAEVREGPSAEIYHLRFRLAEGAEVEVLERRQDGWIKISAHTATGEQKGYVSSDDLGLVDAP